MDNVFTVMFTDGRTKVIRNPTNVTVSDGALVVDQGSGKDEKQFIFSLANVLYSESKAV